MKGRLQFLVGKIRRGALWYSVVDEYTCCWYREILQKQAGDIPLTNKATLDHHFRAFPRKVTKHVYLFRLCVSSSKTSVCTYTL